MTEEEEEEEAFSLATNSYSFAIPYSERGMGQRSVASSGLRAMAAMKTQYSRARLRAMEWMDAEERTTPNRVRYPERLVNLEWVLEEKAAIFFASLD